MKIKLLVAISDQDYSDHLSHVLSEKYADTFAVNICTSLERFHALISSGRYDIVLSEAGFITGADLKSVISTMLLYDEAADVSPEPHQTFAIVRKYQRISSLVGSILEQYALVGGGGSDLLLNRAHITAVWSPAGGTGKTTIALAYAANRVSGGVTAVYLNLENFSGTSAYFAEKGKSISTVFNKLETDVHLLLKGIHQQDSGSGIHYFCGPDNYDDINVLTVEDIEILLKACSLDNDELIIDLSSQCDERVQKVFDMADTILIVSDSPAAVKLKLKQFISQHNVWQRIRHKSVLVNNRGASADGNMAEAGFGRIISLPLIHSADPISVYKTLSGSNFDW